MQHLQQFTFTCAGRLSVKTSAYSSPGNCDIAVFVQSKASCHTLSLAAAGPLTCFRDKRGVELFEFNVTRFYCFCNGVHDLV